MFGFAAKVRKPLEICNRIPAKKRKKRRKQGLGYLPFLFLPAIFSLYFFLLSGILLTFAACLEFFLLC